MVRSKNLIETLAREREKETKELVEKTKNVAIKVKIEKTEAMAKEKATKLAKEKAAREKLAKEKIDREKSMKEKAERDKLAKEKASKAKAEREKAAREKVAIEKAKKETTAKEKFEREEAAREEVAKEKKVREEAAREKKAIEEAARHEEREIAGKSKRPKLVKQRNKSEKSKPKEKDILVEGDVANHQSKAIVLVAPPAKIGSVKDDDFDVEADDRDEFFTAQMAKEFAEEEEPIRHDEYPDTDDERQAGDGSNKENPQFWRGHGSIYMGQTFYSGVAFKEIVLDYVLQTGYNLRQYRHDKDKIGFCCVGSADCKFQVYASSLPRDPKWRIRVLKDKHSCIPNGECDMFKIPVIARLFVDKLREEPDYYLPMKIEEIILERWKISVSRAQCQHARNNALRWIQIEADHQFSRLRDYAAEILECNRGSTVVIDTVPDEKGNDVFSRFYVCFDVLRRTWKKTCRPLIGVDGCFLKAKIKGQLLVAIGRDADNAIYPIAWSVVQVENKENWLWFIRMLKMDLDLCDGDGFIMVSDRQKGLISAVELELPKIEHRMCVRHIYANLKKDHASKLQMKPLIWNLAWSYNEADFQQRLERIHAYDLGVYESVMKSNPRSWCRAFYKIGNYCEDVENNSTESFNRTINKAREKHFVAMLEAVRRLAMVRISKRSAISHHHQGLCTPYATNFLQRQHEQAAICRVSPSTNNQYEVQLSGNTFRVCLRRLTCTCNKFQICGIPCEHAYGVILNKKLNPEDYVCQWFKTNMWRLNYTEGLVPQRSPKFWPFTDGADIHIPPEPAQPGRRKVTKAEKKRMRGVNESPTKSQPAKKLRTMHCGICGSPDHNCRTHYKHESSQAATGTQESQSQLSVTATGTQVSQNQLSVAATEG